MVLALGAAGRSCSCNGTPPLAPPPGSVPLTLLLTLLLLLLLLPLRWMVDPWWTTTVCCGLLKPGTPSALRWSTPGLDAPSGFATCAVPPPLGVLQVPPVALCLAPAPSGCRGEMTVQRLAAG